METKVCSKCGVEKPLSDFYKQANGKYGRHSWCKECYREHQNNSSISYPPKTEGAKVCTRCGVEYPIAFFNKSKRSKDGRSSYCKDCTHVITIKSQLQRRYNITLEEYNAMLKSQDYKCAICEKPLVRTQSKSCVDHNHQTGEVRGILCFQCNTAAGLVNEDILTLRRMIDYLS